MPPLYKRKLTPYNLRANLHKYGIYDLDKTLSRLNKQYQEAKKLPGYNKIARKIKMNAIKKVLNKTRRLERNIASNMAQTRGVNYTGARTVTLGGQLLYENFGEINIRAALAGKYGDSIRDAILKFAKYYNKGDVEDLINQYEYLISIK